MQAASVFLLLHFAINYVSVDGARILAIFPHIGKSHFDVFEPYVKVLAQRGHQVFVLSHFPQLQPLANYTDISLKGSVDFLSPTEGISLQQMAGQSIMAIHKGLAFMGVTTCEQVLNYSTVQHLLQSNETYDLIIAELFNTDCFLAFAHRFPAPVIAMSSCSPMPWANERFGNPDNPSYIPNIFETLGDHMTFWERLRNTVLYLADIVLYNVLFDSPSEKIARKFFGEKLPPLKVIAQNTSLMLVNNHFSINGPRPLVPAVVDVGGIHMPSPKALPKDIETFLNESEHGVIYFNMGSMIRATTIHEDKLQAYLKAFSQLQQRVIWKWESDTLPWKPDNVMIRKWLPQFDILRHPSVRVYMGHGGLLGTMEAVYTAVPMLGTPIFGDQRTNLRCVEDAGMALRLDYHAVTENSLLQTLGKLLHDSKYQENAKHASQQFRDRPMSAMDTAIFWTEYVIRHKGAPQLRSAAVDLNIFQYLLLDVLTLVFFIITCVLIFMYYAARTLTKIIYPAVVHEKLN